MSGPPLSPGFVHVAVRLVDEPETAASTGLSGLADFSSASVTSIVTAMVAVPPLSSSAFTVTA